MKTIKQEDIDHLRHELKRQKEDMEQAYIRWQGNLASLEYTLNLVAHSLQENKNYSQADQ